MGDKAIQLCHLLFESTFQTYNQGKAIDAVIDDQPTVENIANLVKYDELNRLAFNELEQFNKHQVFLFKHPLVFKRKLEEQLDALRRSDPADFMKQLANAKSNITRYNSMIKNNKYKNDEELGQWREHIKVAEQKLAIMEVLISK